MLDEAARENYLEDVAAEAVANASADVLLMLFVGEGRGHFADGAEAEGLDVSAVDAREEFVNLLLARGCGVVGSVGDEGDELIVLLKWSKTMTSR